MDIHEELKSGGAYPSGPCSAWPQERHEKLFAAHADKRNYKNGPTAREVKPDIATMAGGILKTAKQAVQYGRVSPEIRAERYATCKSCPMFDSKSKRCNSCGCFMEAKTWVGGDPNTLCPLKKWKK